jgi:hypothetical protein
MSRENTTTDNAVGERFIRTFKEHKIHGITIEEQLQTYLLIDPNLKSLRSVINQYIKSFNQKPNRKSFNRMSPQKHDTNSSTASMLMIEPTYAQSFSEHFGEDPRRHDVALFKSQSDQILSYMKEIAAKEAEVVNNTFLMITKQILTSNS